ncbi:hypothetical protein [Nocardioides montaniterrae]
MSTDSPFLRLTSLHHDDVATDGVVELLRKGGIEQITMSAVARWKKVTPSAMHHQYGGRARFVEAVVDTFAGRWVRWAILPAWGSAVPMRMPEEPAECEGVRAWSMIRALAEGERRAVRPAAAESVAWALGEERAPSCAITSPRRWGSSSVGSMSTSMRTSSARRRDVPARLTHR